MLRATPLANPQGLSLSLPYVPGRLVIEVSDPAGKAARGASGTDYPESVNGQLTLVQDLRFGNAAEAPSPSSSRR